MMNKGLLEARKHKAKSKQMGYFDRVLVGSYKFVRDNALFVGHLEFKAKEFRL